MKKERGAYIASVCFGLLGIVAFGFLVLRISSPSSDMPKLTSTPRPPAFTQTFIVILKDGTSVEVVAGDWHRYDNHYHFFTDDPYNPYTNVDVADFEREDVQAIIAKSSMDTSAPSEQGD